MELGVYWTNFAKTELNNIFNYYKENANIKVAKNIVEGIVKKTLILSLQPNVGSKEFLLEGREQDFYYLIHKNYKIIYFENKPKNRIDILDVFDTRQNPIKLKRNI